MSGDLTLDTGGRYVYCVATTGDSSSPPDVTGIDDGQVRLVEHGDLGAIVQPVERIFDTTDAATARRWILTHQQVVEAATDRYGTVLPFRFDTILEGDDEAVERWVADREEALRSVLDHLAEVNEYRIQLSWDEQEQRQELGDEESLAELEERMESANDGTRYLVEQQYERTADGLLTDRKAELAEELHAAVDPVVERIEIRDTAVGSDLGTELADADTDVVATLSVLAGESEEAAIGDRLERFEQRPGLSVRFTGPWPPYTFAANLWEEG